MKNRLIEVFKDGKYILTTNRYKTCREALAFLRSKSFIFVAGRELKGEAPMVELYNHKLTAFYKK